MKKIALIILILFTAIFTQSCCGPCETIQSGAKVYKYKKGDIIVVAGKQFIIKYDGSGMNDKCEDVNDKTYRCNPFGNAGDGVWLSESTIDKYQESPLEDTLVPEVDSLPSDSTYY